MSERSPSTASCLFLGGFFSGEGSFNLDGRALATIHLRADDRLLLERFRDTFGLGSVAYSTPPGANPTVRWSVCRKAELPAMIALLDAAVLRGRKRREFEAWRLGAAEYARGRDRDRAVIESAARALADARAYVARPVELPRDRSAREVYAEVLRDWAAQVDGALTCTAYVEARRGHPEWPTRNTVTIAFGSWAAALDAAGLGARAGAKARARARAPRLRKIPLTPKTRV